MHNDGDFEPRIYQINLVQSLALWFGAFKFIMILFDNSLTKFNFKYFCSDHNNGEYDSIN